MIETTVRQREIIEHSLGLPYNKKPYRSHYCTSNGDPVLEEMVTVGLMSRGRVINEGRDRYYYVTEMGATAVKSHLPRD